MPIRKQTDDKRRFITLTEGIVRQLLRHDECRRTRAATSVASPIGADPDEVVFTSGATEANNLALLGLACRARSDRRRILVSAIEHNCVLATARSLAEREGFAVETIPVGGDGFVDLEALETMVDETVLAVSVMAVNNEVGTIQDIESLS